MEFINMEEETFLQVENINKKDSSHLLTLHQKGISEAQFGFE